MRILLTGATGFLGQHFTDFNKAKYLLIPVSVREGIPLPPLIDIDAVLHFGGKAHEMKSVPDEIYFTSNAELTRQLGVAAKAAGVSHFVYASSVKVYGNVLSGKIDEYSECHPDDAYGKSKLLAEKYLLELASENFTVSIIRPTLIYGSHVKGNMKKLLKLAKKNIPLPFGNIENKRSMVSIDNLIALIDIILRKRKGGIFIAADEMPISTTHLVSLVRKYLEKEPNLIDIPKWLQTIIKKVHYPLYIRLFGSYVVDNIRTKEQLNYKPPYSTEEGIKKMTEWFKIVSK